MFMAGPKKSVALRIARMRQDNSLASAPPPAIYANAPMKSRRVGKSGAVHIPELAHGVRVNYMQVDAETFVVSSRPESEVRAIASKMPTASPSPFAALSDSLRGRRFEFATSRDRVGFHGAPRVAEASDDDVLVAYDLRPSRRVR